MQDDMEVESTTEGFDDGILYDPIDIGTDGCVWKIELKLK